MKIYINIFLTLVMPLSIIFIAISVVYYSIDFTFSKAIKLGIVTGILSSTLFTILLTAGILLLRKIQGNKPKVPNYSYSDSNKVPKILKEHQKNYDTDIVRSKSLEKKFMLLMDRELAYEVSLQSMLHQNIGEIIYQNKDKGLILLKNDEKELKLNITTLTKHTAEILITSTLDYNFIKEFMSLMKKKEHLFLSY